MNLGSKAGVTLPEAVISCMVLGIALSGLMTGFVMCQKSVVFANNGLTAMHEARQVMEDLVTKRYSDPALNTGTHTLTNGNYVVTESAGSKDVTLTIQWTDPTRQAPSKAVLTTSIAYAVHP